VCFKCKAGLPSFQLVQSISYAKIRNPCFPYDFYGLHDFGFDVRFQEHPNLEKSLFYFVKFSIFKKAGKRTGADIESRQVSQS